MPRIQQLTYTPLQEAEPLRVAAYCRVSSDSADQLNSYTAQIQFYTEYIGQHPDWVLADIYADEGLTGTKTEKRDELKRLIADSRKGKIDRVIVKAVSRFARNLYDSLSLARLLKSYGTSVYFEEQKIDTAQMNDELMLTMQSMAAQGESMTISQNMRWSYRERMAKGEYVGTIPAYGYKLVDGSLEIDEPEARIVRRIFDLYLSGMGKPAIANAMNEEGAPRRYGKERWYVNTIHYILNNERYRGDALLQKKYTTPFPFQKVQNKGEMPQYYVENSHPAIVAGEVFEAAQRVQAGKHRHKKKAPMHHPLSGKMHCADCGHPFRRHIVNGIAYWLCSYPGSEQTDCRSHWFPEDSIVDAFTLLVNKLAAHRDTILTPMIRQLERMQNRSGNTQSKICEIEREIAVLNNQNHLITTHRSQGFMDASEYAAQSGAVHHRVSALRTERRKLLTADENDEMIDELKTLDAALSGQNEVRIDFDECLFTSIVTGVAAVSETELRFRMIGGLELTETITRTERRSNR